MHQAVTHLIEMNIELNLKNVELAPLKT